jgi:hypothetical protein
MVNLLCGKYVGTYIRWSDYMYSNVAQIIWTNISLPANARWSIHVLGSAHFIGVLDEIQRRLNG